MDKIVQHSNFTPGKQPRRLPVPRISFLPCIKRDCIPPASKCARAEISVPRHSKSGSNRCSFGGSKQKMRQPYRHFCGVRRNGNFAPKNLKIHASADLWSKISPDNRVRIEPDEYSNGPSHRAACLARSLPLMSLSISQPSSGIRRAIKSYCFSKSETSNSPSTVRRLARQGSNASCSRAWLDHNLVAGMATGHKATWSLHLHVERTG
jgi:hypothetical protein